MLQPARIVLLGVGELVDYGVYELPQPQATGVYKALLIFSVVRADVLPSANERDDDLDVVW